MLPEDIFDTLPEPCEEEEDMLDLAFGLTAESRLGCQVFLTTDMEGMEVITQSNERFYEVSQNARTGSIARCDQELLRRRPRSAAALASLTPYPPTRLQPPSRCNGGRDRR